MILYPCRRIRGGGGVCSHPLPPLNPKRFFFFFGGGACQLSDFFRGGVASWPAWNVNLKHPCWRRRHKSCVCHWQVEHKSRLRVIIDDSHVGLLIWRVAETAGDSKHINYVNYRRMHSFIMSIPCGLVVRIRGFHPRGPGSIPGTGDLCFLSFFYKIARQFLIHFLNSSKKIWRNMNFLFINKIPIKASILSLLNPMLTIKQIFFFIYLYF